VPAAEGTPRPAAEATPSGGAGEPGSNGRRHRLTGREDDAGTPPAADEGSGAGRWLRLARDKAAAAAGADHGDEPGRLSDRLRRVVAREHDAPAPGPTADAAAGPAAGPGTAAGASDPSAPATRPPFTPPHGEDPAIEEWRPRRLAEAAARRRAQEAAEAAGRPANIPGTDTPGAPRLVPGANWPPPDPVDDDTHRRPDEAPGDADGAGADKKLGARVAKFLNRKDAE
jgi:hypothetical protein